MANVRTVPYHRVVRVCVGCGHAFVIRGKDRPTQTMRQKTCGSRDCMNVKKMQNHQQKLKQKGYWHEGSTEALLAWQDAAGNKALQNKVYTDGIHGPLMKLAENLLNVYKLYELGGVWRDLQVDCVTHCYSKLDHYDRKRETNPFSYFNVVAKMFLVHEIQKRQKHGKLVHSYEQLMDNHATHLNIKMIAARQKMERDMVTLQPEFTDDDEHKQKIEELSKRAKKMAPRRENVHMILDLIRDHAEELADGQFDFSHRQRAKAKREIFEKIKERCGLTEQQLQDALPQIRRPRRPKAA